ncbi:hypothetical protein SAMN04489743_0302 [Pseudarthrobacter equi]|uniref:Uncharacterized protein n=1 Tax=Pseudarthrobacter equi TaxID=728066 RepID=A0A1H1T3D8_9MICC|nr:hypothetical protein SAMN04489743_0302 [Pseudarthrobacter equi]
MQVQVEVCLRNTAAGRNGEHVKKLLVLAAAIAGVLLYRKAQESEARKDVWSKSTDTVN